MFIVDALIGNWDRHNGNWGFLYNLETDNISIAPVYDCGSSLYPQADNKIMEKTLNSKNEMNLRIYEIPTSAIKINEKRIRYYDFISSLSNNQCNQALKRILPKINLSKIKNIINEIPLLNDLQKEFYYTMISERKNKILDHSFNLLRTKDLSSLNDYIEAKNFDFAFSLFLDKESKENNLLNFMKEVLKTHGTNGEILKSAVDALTEACGGTPEFAHKLLNDTLKIDEYKQAFE